MTMRQIASLCPSCHHANPLDSAFCRACGAPVIPPESNSVTGQSERPAAPPPQAVAGGGPERSTQSGSRRARTALLVGASVGLTAAGAVALLLHEGGRSHHAGSPTRPAAGKRETDSAAVVPPSQRFHSPTGNISCEIGPDSAACTVASLGETFVLPANGRSAYVSRGIRLSRGSGSLKNWGAVVSAGPVSCTVPLENQPHGTICENHHTGHGFEASRHSNRQRVF